MPRQEKTGEHAASGRNEQGMNSNGAMDFFPRNAQDKHEANDRQQRKEKCPEQDSYGPKIEAADSRAI
jgi:hypothetical protein